ncbi:hypothetical protein H4R33_000504 [Dimargaris cristalligena]|uniref:HTH TFE/IIEalpha-type domain-containing protein n=1 Tax=Dimargaris cristalligena TaxID=215637 RepID=A0A4P9ZXL3_9FUNG|nr:hypothetical protein H4R33_000504 [Dimargaris cristalligena]RKP38414.1 hypothetical protein BJ085DRAFT_41001 [Dimargaris cristalligena]|eukprot:RKP38414.1 hypothetical protein BJ085DRAFT_41001 [Dimargaris cristalligena]
MDVVKALVSCVARAFYDTRLVLALDYINYRESVRDDELARFLRITPREAHRVGGKLKESSLIKVATRMEARRPEVRALAKTYYYMDYKHFVDVIKWKMWKLQKTITERMQSEVDKKGYACPNCQASYDPLEILHLLDATTGLFYCELCRTELIENENADQSTHSKETLSRLMDDCRPIIDLLKKTDSLIIPATNFVSTLQASEDAEAATEKAKNDNPDYELSVARDTGAGSSIIKVVFENEETTEAARKAHEAELDKKRQQNALPAWHMYSTVSGVKTELGRRSGENNSNSSYSTGLISANEGRGADHQEHIAEYYADLERATPASSQATPVNGSDTNGSLSRDDSVPKFSLDGSTTTNSRSPSGDLSSNNAYTPMNGIETPADQSQIPADYFDDDEPFDMDDVPMVRVNGHDVSLDLITDEHRAQMTPEEYEEYWKILQTLI